MWQTCLNSFICFRCHIKENIYVYSVWEMVAAIIVSALCGLETHHQEDHKLLFSLCSIYGARPDWTEIQNEDGCLFRPQELLNLIRATKHTYSTYISTYVPWMLMRRIGTLVRCLQSYTYYTSRFLISLKATQEGAAHVRDDRVLDTHRTRPNPFFNSNKTFVMDVKHTQTVWESAVNTFTVCVCVIVVICCFLHGLLFSKQLFFGLSNFYSAGLWSLVGRRVFMFVYT